METPNSVARGATGPRNGRRRADRLIDPDWFVELERQDRSFGWLARHTDRSTSAVSRYANGSLTPPAEWVEEARRVLGIKVAA